MKKVSKMFKIGLALAFSCGVGLSFAQEIDACKDEMGHQGDSKTTQGQNNQSVTGNVGSSPYHYEIWYQGGNNNMTFYDNGTYKASWNGTGDFLARVGFKYNEDKSYSELGPIDAYFKWSKSGSAGGYNYIGIYGWTVDPLVEYYIVDDWFSEPGANLLGQRKGEFTVDGATYEIYQNTRNNAPSIKGNQTFPQYFSKRSELWSADGDNSMTYYGDGTFKAEWSNTWDYVARVGIRSDVNNAYKTGNYTVDFKFTKSGNTPYGYIGVHGLAEEPQAEYFIVDDSAIP